MPTDHLRVAQTQHDPGESGRKLAKKPTGSPRQRAIADSPGPWMAQHTRLAAPQQYEAIIDGITFGLPRGRPVRLEKRRKAATSNVTRLTANLPSLPVVM